MHLRQLELCRGAHARWEGRVADDIAEGLSIVVVCALVSQSVKPRCRHSWRQQSSGPAASVPSVPSSFSPFRLDSFLSPLFLVLSLFFLIEILGYIVPLGLVLLVHLPLGVVADDLDVDKTAQIELLGPDARHDGQVGAG